VLRFLRALLRLLPYPAFGAIAFWGPDLLLHAIRERGLVDVLVLSVVQPLFPALLLWRVSKNLSHCYQSSARGILLLLGIWLSGPSAMMLGWTIAGAGFTSTGGARVGSSFQFLRDLTLEPIYTVEMSTYEMTLLGLVLATLALPALGISLDVQRVRLKRHVQEGA